MSADDKPSDAAADAKAAFKAALDRKNAAAQGGDAHVDAVRGQAHNTHSQGGKRQFRRGVYDEAAGTVTTYGPPASHHLRWLASANCLLEIDEDVTRITAGEQVLVWDLSSGGRT